jgi:acyl carrier protein
MSERKAIEAKLLEFVATDLLHGDAEDLTASTNLLALGVIDSLSIELMSGFIERSFGVELPHSAQPEDLTTVQAVAAMVERLKRDAAAGR